MTKLPLLPKHKTRLYATNEPPNTPLTAFFASANKLSSRAHKCMQTCQLHIEQSAESVEAAEDWTNIPSVSRYLRYASHWSCLHSQPQAGMLTITYVQL